MSELTTCNYCNTRRVIRRLEEQGFHPTVAPSKEMPGWFTVLTEDGKEHGWYKEVSYHCVC